FAVASETGATAYDIPGAEPFSHDGELCSFDAFLKVYGIEDRALDALALIVRGADTARLELTPQSPGLLALSLGLSANFPDDHAMLGHGMVMYDALYAWCRSLQGETHIGWLMHRWPGAIIAGGLFVVPGIVSIMGLSYVYAAYGNVPIVASLFFGLKAAVLAIVLHAVHRVGSRALKSRPMLALAALAFIGIFFLGVPFPLIVLAAAVIGFVGARAGSSVFQV